MKFQRPPVRADITIRGDCPAEASSWNAWLDFCRRSNRDDLADAAIAAGAIVVGRRWPKSESALPRIATDFTPRLTGEKR